MVVAIAALPLANMAVEQPNFAVHGTSIGFCDVGASTAQSFDFGACQHKTCFDGFGDLILKSCLAVFCHLAVIDVMGFGGGGFLGHGRFQGCGVI